MRKRKDSVYTSAFIFPSLVHLLERKLSQGQPGFWEAQGGSLGSKPNCFHSGRVFDEAASDTQQQQAAALDGSWPLCQREKQQHGDTSLSGIQDKSLVQHEICF